MQGLPDRGSPNRRNTIGGWKHAEENPGGAERRDRFRRCRGFAAGGEPCRRPRGADRSLQPLQPLRSEEHTSELQSLMRLSYAVFCLKKTNKQASEELTVRCR